MDIGSDDGLVEASLWKLMGHFGGVLLKKSKQNRWHRYRQKGMFHT